MTETHLILGLPKAGKTTFIAALWYVVETNRLPGALELVELPENRQHLNELRDRWVSCLEQVHTSTPTEKVLRLKLRNPGTGQVTELVVPDLSGESFELQWSHRQCSKSYFDLASEASGLLLFINAEVTTEAPTIAEEEALGDAVRDEPSGATATPQPPQPLGSAEVPWDGAFAPPQVKLIEVLQFLTVPPFRDRKFRCAVVISAWDRVQEKGVTPAQWLAGKMPLLSQFLRANNETFESQVYGLSATGGRMQTDAQRREAQKDPEIERLQAHHNPEDRIQVVMPVPSTISHDITAPVRCIMK